MRSAVATHPKGVVKLFDRILTVARREFDPIAIVETRGAIGVRIEGDWQIDVMAYPCGCIFISSLRLFIPPERTVEALELVNRVNVTYVTGTLEIDFADRQMRLRHDLEAPPAVINCGLLRALIRYNFHRAQDLIPKLRAFLERKLSAQQVAGDSAPSSSAITGCNSQRSRTETTLRNRWLPKINLN
jgi:hypothetical protein